MPLASTHPACIGPNAILQTLQVLDGAGGASLRDAVMVQAGVAVPAADAGMVPETDCAAVHHALRVLLPSRAEALLRASGLATGDYILRHRIPRAAQVALRLLPRRIAARLLSRAIAHHAWTFAGSGSFHVARKDPLEFTVTGNPLIKGMVADHPACHWHAAVFERLFARLVWPGVVVTETACVATGAKCCCFQIQPHARG